MNLQNVTNKKRLLVSLCVLSLVAWFMHTQHAAALEEQVPSAVQGELDLTNWDFESDGTVRLSGEWEFYWKQLLDADDFAHTSESRQAIIAEVPNVWSNYEVNEVPLPGQGYATYRLRVKSHPDQHEFALKIPTLSTSCKVMIDDQVVAECGYVATDEESADAAYSPQIVMFQANADQFDLIVQISNYMYNSGGMWYALDMGTESQMTAYHDIGLGIDMMMMGTFLFMGIYHIFIYFQRRSLRTAILFGVGCLIGAARLWLSGEIFVLKLFPDLSIPVLTMLSYLTYYGGIMLFVLYLRDLYPHEVSRRMTGIVTGVSCLFILTVLVTPLPFYTEMIIYYHFFMFLVSMALIRIVWLAVKRRRDGARLQCFGIFFFILTFVVDIAVNAFYVSAAVHHTLFIYLLNRQMVLIGLFVLVFVQAIILSRRYSRAFHTIEEMSHKLLAQDKLKDEFLMNTSHEFITPLHGIMNISQSMMEGAEGKLNAAQKENMSIIVSVTRGLTNLVSDILDFSKLKNNEIELHKRQVSLQAVMQVNMEVFRYFIEDKPLHLHNMIPDDLPAVYADENRLQQILYNLIGNAIKFTEQGSIVISAECKGELVEVHVTDTGIGIPADKQELIFQSFEQVGAAVSREYGGTGLGLSITKKLVELNGGQLQVDSKWGEGSTFTFTLPVSRNGEADQVRSHFSHHRVPDSVRQPRDRVYEQTSYQNTILSVDDDPTNQQVIKNVLAQEPYRILTASHGEEALAMLDGEDKIDLVILDVMMPGMTGYEVARHIRKRRTLTDLPILLVTVKHAPEDLLGGFAAGANDFLAKPFHSHELRARVRTLLELRNSVEQAIQLEMNFLRAQIKPHFLYNALSTIIGICPRDPKKASQLLKKLSHYLRSSFDFQNKETFIPIQSELELLESYVMIEKARFKERLRIKLDVDESIDAMLPPLSIQPLVENAIRHGVMKRIEGGTVKVSVAHTGDGIRISVEDDGVGMSEDKLAGLLSIEQDNRGVGIINIHQRLMRIYGTGLEIESSEGQGTKVVFNLSSKNKGGAD